MEVRSKLVASAFRVLVFFHNHALDPDAEQPLQSEDGIWSHSGKSTVLVDDYISLPTPTVLGSVRSLSLRNRRNCSYCKMQRS